MACVVYDPAEVARAITAYRAKQLRTSKLVLSEATAQCAVCGHGVERVVSARDELRASTIYLVRCHGAEEQIEVTDQQAMAGLRLAFVGAEVEEQCNA